MKKKLFNTYPYGILLILGVIGLVLACLLTFISAFRLEKPMIAELEIPVVYIPKPSTSFTTVQQKHTYQIDESTPLLAITAKRSYFTRLQSYKDGLEQNSSFINYDSIEPKHLALATINYRNNQFAKANPQARTLVVLPSPEIEMIKLKEIIYFLKIDKSFDKVILATGVI